MKKEKLIKYLINVASLIFIIGIAGGIFWSLVKGWSYIRNGYFSAFMDLTYFAVIKSTIVTVFFMFLFFIIFLLFLRLSMRINLPVFLSSAIAAIPFLLYWVYQIDTSRNIYWSNFLEWESIVFNLKLGSGLAVAWFIVTILILFWVKSRMLKPTTISFKAFGFFLMVFLFFIFAPSIMHTQQSNTSPNVIILLIDALRADHLSCYGYDRPTTPNIDKFARKGVCFTRAISQSTFTKSSIASLFTSRYPYQHGVYWGNRKDKKENFTSDILNESETTIAEVLSQNDFLSMAWVTNGQLRAYTGMAQGFIEYTEPAGSVSKINEAFLRWVKQIGEKNRFFTYLHYLDLHDPYHPKPPFDTLYGAYSDVYARMDLEKWGYYRDAIQNGKIKLSGKDVEQLMAYYDGILTYIDQEIGRLFKELKESGVYDNSMIILTSDHGDGFMEHGFISHSTTPYDELIHVPLIIKFPNSKYEGQVIPFQVRLIDVMPTITDYLNISSNSDFEGSSLIPILEEDNVKEQKANVPKFALTEIAVDSGYPILSIRTERYKYIHFQYKEDELYELVDDRAEIKNLLHLETEQSQYFSNLALNIVEKRKQNEAERVRLDKKTIEELRSLGYIK